MIRRFETGDFIDRSGPDSLESSPNKLTFAAKGFGELELFKNI